MAVNLAVLHRAKHFDLLLSRQLESIQREHGVNATIHQKLKNAIRREYPRHHISLPFDEIYDRRTETFDHRKMCLKRNDGWKSMVHLSTDISTIAPTQTDASASNPILESSPHRRRHCTKVQLLPPIVRPNESHRGKQTSRDLLRIFPLRTPTVAEANPSDPMSSRTVDSMALVQAKVDNFLQALPPSKNVRSGFDSFALASLYVTRTPICIR